MARPTVGCGVERLKRHRAVATRHDRLAVRYGATVPVAVLPVLPVLPVASGS